MISAPAGVARCKLSFFLFRPSRGLSYLGGFSIKNECSVVVKVTLSIGGGLVPLVMGYWFSVSRQCRILFPHRRLRISPSRRRFSSYYCMIKCQKQISRLATEQILDHLWTEVLPTSNLGGPVLWAWSHPGWILWTVCKDFAEAGSISTLSPVKIECEERKCGQTS